MIQPVNLNRFRKAAAKAASEKTASENRVKHGRTKAQKHADAHLAKAPKKTVDQHKRAPKT